MCAVDVVGKSRDRVDARDKVTGRALYPADIHMENMAYGATVRSTYPSAEIKVDKSAAVVYPGVLHVFTAEDIPGKKHHGVLLKDHEVFCSKRVRRIGEPIAFIVAESAEAAEEAAMLVQVEYKELPAVFDPREAMKEASPKVHGESNIIYHYKLSKGNAEEAFEKCDVIVENFYETSMVDQAFLQPEAGVAYPDEDGGINIIVATQYPHFDREEVAEALDIPAASVRVMTSAVGGAFGGREDITVQIHLALAAYKLNRPVKTVYSREESFQAHSKRHPMYIKYKSGALKDGSLAAVEVEIIGDSGAHASWAINVLRKAGVHAAGPYVIPNVKVDSYAVYTNNPYTGAMRGFGAAQLPMAYEQQMDEIAAKLGMNPVDIRLKNCLRKGSETATGQILEESVPLVETITKAADAIGFGYLRDLAAADMKKRGKGIASTFYGTGYGNGFPDVSNVWAELKEDGRIYVYAGATEVGQGAKTVLTQIAAETLGIDMARVILICEDTGLTPDSGTAAASRQTYNTGNGIRKACDELKAIMIEYSKKYIGLDSIDNMKLRNGRIEALSLTDKYISFEKLYEEAEREGRRLRAESAFTAHTTRMDDETGQGAPYWPYTFTTYCTEVEVNTETGKVDLIKAACAQDVGRAINPMLIEGQIEGGFAMGMSWALYEELGLNQGRIKNNNYSKYIIPTALDMPDIQSIIVEDPESTAPFGAKGIGEPVMLAAMPAILNAIYDAVGVRIKRLPASPQEIVRAMQDV